MSFAIRNAYRYVPKKTWNLKYYLFQECKVFILRQSKYNIKTNTLYNI